MPSKIEAASQRDEGPAASAAAPPPRGFLAAAEHGIYRLLRGPVFLVLVLFRRFAGR